MRFIVLTDAESGLPVYVNAAAVKRVVTDIDDMVTRVQMGAGNWVGVKEGAATVVEMVEGCLERNERGVCGMGYSRCEQETSVVWDEEGKVARIYTASPVSMRKLEKLCRDYPNEYRRVWSEQDGDGRMAAAKYETGCRMIRFSKPREMSQEQRDAARERLSRCRSEGNT